MAQDDLNILLICFHSINEDTNNSFGLKKRHKKWLGHQGSNLGMTESKSVALPLGYGPMLNGGPDGTRTRDLLRDRQAF